MPTINSQNRITNTGQGAAARPIANPQQSNGSRQPQRPRRSGWKSFGIVVLLLFIALIGVGFGFLYRILSPGKGAPGSKQLSFTEQIGKDFGVIGDPQGGFPGMHKVVVCCMGIDDNWTNSDEVYTVGARTDTLFLLTLDLDNKKITMLSIPRDTYVPIAGTHYSSKINAAYATGGPARTVATVEQFMGVHPDYYMVLNIDATKRLVDALGGVDVDVEHRMDYDDNWGHLHVHLKPGQQHLTGDQAVGFARYRHGSPGTITPEDGDERRMYRQHVLLQAMVKQAKSPGNVANFGNLVDIGMSCIRTDLQKYQIADLAAIFHGVDPATDITSASLVGADARGPHGAYVMEVDQNQAREYAAWLVNGDQAAARALTTVRVANGTSVSGLAAQATNALHGLGYQNTALAPAAGKAKMLSVTQIVDTGVADHAAAADIASLLGTPNALISRKPVTPDKSGWTPLPAIEVTLGTDYAGAAKTR